MLATHRTGGPCACGMSNDGKNISEWCINSSLNYEWHFYGRLRSRSMAGCGWPRSHRSRYIGIGFDDSCSCSDTRWLVVDVSTQLMWLCAPLSMSSIYCPSCRIEMYRALSHGHKLIEPCATPNIDETGLIDHHLHRCILMSISVSLSNVCGFCSTMVLRHLLLLLLVGRRARMNAWTHMGFLRDRPIHWR